MKTLRIVGTVAWVCLAGVLAGLFWVTFTAEDQPSTTDTASIGGPFTLTDQSGKSRSWSDFRGKATAVFFGFTHCPEICPTTLWELSERLREFGTRGDQLNVVLISVDPQRDTPEVLGRYLQSFDPRIVALTGDDTEVEDAVKAFRAYRKRIPQDDGYTMDHSALVFLFNEEGRFVSTLDRHETADVQRQKLERVMAD